MRHFSSAKKDRRLHLITISDKALNVFLFKLIIVFIDFWPKLYFLDLNDLLFFLCLTESPFLRVLIAAKIHNTTDRRRSCRRDFYEVEALFSGDDQSLLRWHDAELFSGIVNNPHFTNSNSFVGADPVLWTS